MKKYLVKQSIVLAGKIVLPGTIVTLDSESSSTTALINEGHIEDSKPGSKQSATKAD